MGVFSESWRGWGSRVRGRRWWSRSDAVFVVDFGQDTIVALSGERREGRLRLRAVETWEGDVGAEDAEGRKTAFLKAFVLRNGIRSPRALVVVPAESVWMQGVTVGDVPADEIPGAVKWRLKGKVPFAVESAFLDFQVVRETSDSTGKKIRRILVCLGRRTVITPYLDLLRESGIQPVGLSPAPVAYAAFLRGGGDASPAVEAVLEIESATAVLGLYIDGRLCFIRRMPFSMNRAVEAMTGALVTEKGRVRISPERARGFLEEEGLDGPEEAVTAEGLSRGPLLAMIRPLLETLVREIRLSCDYFAAHFENLRPSGLRVTGKGARIKGIEAYLDRELSVPVSSLSWGEGTVEGEPPIGTSSLAATAAVGAALTGGGGIDLLPPEIRSQRVEVLQWVSLRLTALTAVMVFLLLLFIVRFRVQDYENRLRIARQHQRTIESVQQDTVVEQQLEALVARIRRGHVPVDGLLKVVGRAIPQELLLDGLTCDQDKGEVFLEGTLAAGDRRAEEILTAFVQQLETSPFFKDAELVTTQRMGVMVRFAVRGYLERENSPGRSRPPS